MRELIIGDRPINDESPCYVIAELGCNHGGDVQTAKLLIDAAVKAGASAVKFQKRENRTLYAQALLDRAYENEASYGPTYGAHRQALELSDLDYADVFEYAQWVHHAPLFATAFDEPSAAFLSRFDPPAYKVHSGGLKDRSLLAFLKGLGKPIILSTGGGDIADIDRAHKLLGDTPHAILHCTASYPLKPEEANLRAILTLRNRYPDTVIGFSSHSPGIAFSLIAYAFGARIIEHHVTLSRASKGTDHAFSLEPKALATLVEDLGKLRLALGDGVKRVYASERSPLAKMTRVETPEGLRIVG